MKINRMYRSTASFSLSIILPAAVIALMVLGMQSYSLIAQLYYCGAGVLALFSVLVLMPAFFEQHARMYALVARRDAFSVIARRTQQRAQYYTLSRALAQHQSRGRAIPVLVRSV